ncbi:MAG: hypothetical protein IPK17_05380 [Chloroflexi bacterium]|nr:hypothetical protein [Chloroflexota bacterium]
MLILDDPTRGIDVGAKYEICKLMRELAAQGMAIIMISSELEEVLGMSDRIMVMSGGRSAGIMPAEGATAGKDHGAGDWNHSLAAKRSSQRSLVNIHLFKR